MYILSIDQGTTGTTACLIDKAGRITAKFNQEHPQFFPKPGWVEHDPAAIWQSVLSSIRKVLELGRVKPDQVVGIGITNQRETVIAWDKETGKSAYPAIVWQCRRTQDFCLQLKKRGLEKIIRKKTGLLLDPYFSSGKIRWILKNVPEAQRLVKKGSLRCGTVDAFLLWNLTGGKSFKTDVSNASRTQLMNLQAEAWDPELLKIFAVPISILPEIVDSSGVFGVTSGVGVLPDGIPIAGMAGDQQSALFGQTGFDLGDAKCTFGTGSFILMNTGSKPVWSQQKLLTTIGWRLPGKKTQFCLEGGAFVCGAAVQWLRDGLGIIDSSAEIEGLALSVPDSGGVEFIPALTGLGAPYWRPDARGIITGLTRGSTAAHIARATLDAMALQNADILGAMQKDLRKKFKALRVDGGATTNNLLMQIQADVLGVHVVRPQQLETTALGAGFLAGLGVGFWSGTDELKKVWLLDRSFDPQMNSVQRAKRTERWRSQIDLV